MLPCHAYACWQRLLQRRDDCQTRLRQSTLINWLTRYGNWKLFMFSIYLFLLLLIVQWNVFLGGREPQPAAGFASHCAWRSCPPWTDQPAEDQGGLWSHCKPPWWSFLVPSWRINCISVISVQWTSAIFAIMNENMLNEVGALPLRYEHWSKFGHGYLDHGPALGADKSHTQINILLLHRFLEWAIWCAWICAQRSRTFCVTVLDVDKSVGLQWQSVNIQFCPSKSSVSLGF